MLPRSDARKLYDACGANNVAQAKELLKKGIDLQTGQGDRQETALIKACSVRSLECAKLLLEAGANPDFPTKDGQTPVGTCIDVHAPELLDLLIEHGAAMEKYSAPLDKSPAPPLILAVLHKEIPCIEVLVKHNCDVNQTAVHGKTPLWYAARDRLHEMASILIKGGARVNDAHSETGTYPLYLACCNGDEEMVKLLLEAGASPNQQTRKGFSSLHAAVVHDFVNIIELLAEVPDLDWGLRSWETAVDVAETHKQDAIAQLLKQSAGLGDQDAVREPMSPTKMANFNSTGSQIALDAMLTEEQQMLVSQTNNLVKLKDQLYFDLQTSLNFAFLENVKAKFVEVYSRPPLRSQLPWRAKGSTAAITSSPTPSQDVGAPPLPDPEPFYPWDFKFTDVLWVASQPEARTTIAYNIQHITGEKYVLTIPVPPTMPMEADYRQQMQKMMEMLMELNHRGIVDLVHCYFARFEMFRKYLLEQRPDLDPTKNATGEGGESLAWLPEDDHEVPILIFTGLMAECQPIRQKLQNGGLPQTEVAVIILQLLQSIVYLQERRILHGNLSFDNILVTENGRVILSDFYFAAYLENQETGQLIQLQDMIGIVDSRSKRGGVTIPKSGYSLQLNNFRNNTLELAAIIFKGEMYSVGRILLGLVTGDTTTKLPGAPFQANFKGYSRLLRKTMDHLTAPVDKRCSAEEAIGNLQWILFVPQPEQRIDTLHTGLRWLESARTAYREKYQNQLIGTGEDGLPIPPSALLKKEDGMGSCLEAEFLLAATPSSLTEISERLCC